MKRALMAVATGLLLGYSQAKAQALPTPAQIDQRAELIRLYVATRRCMGDASVAAIRRGINQAGEVRGFASGLCGGPLKAQLRAMGQSQTAAENLIWALSKLALDDVSTPIL